MALEDWANGVLGNTPLIAERLNERDSLLLASLQQLCRDPSLLFTGAIVRDSAGAPVSASVTWPHLDDEDEPPPVGVYSGTASTTWPGAIDSYTITRVGTPTKTFTQPAVTRDAVGNVTNRPPITIT